MTATSTAPVNQAKFVTGSTMRHVTVMTATGSIGLIAVFIVDALNLFYISLLGVHELAAAIGFASTLMFFVLSISIGFTIATTALVSQTLGRGDRDKAARMSGVSMIFIALGSLAITLAAWPFLNHLLGYLGATGETRALAERYLQIVMLSTPILALGMGSTGIMRAAGDARRSMYVTLSGGMTAAILDPVFIFGFDLGLDGAAYVTILSRLVMLVVGMHGVHIVHRLITLPNLRQLNAAMRPFFAIGFPAILTQLATPVGNTYVTVEMARFGDEAIAGWAIVGRVIPVAFGVIFALTGAIGPILGQNYGAQRYDRLNAALRDAFIFVMFYCLAAWLLLAVFAYQIAGIFGAQAEARELVVFFCHFVAGSFLFTGALFVANSVFNNLGFATYSTLFNWGRSTLGVIPFVWIGAYFYGAKGALAGWGLGAIIFGVVAVITAFRVVRTIGDMPPNKQDLPPPPPPAANSPFSTGKASTLE